MPIKLPVYERQVRATPVNAPQAQVVNASNAQGLDALGRGIQQGAAGAGYAMARAESNEDKLRVDVAATDLLAAKQQLLQDQNGGFLTTKRGQGAITESQSYKDQFANYAKVIGQKLSPSQRAAFESKSAREAIEFSELIDLHVASETKKLEQETSDSIFKMKASEAVSAAVRGDMDAVDNALGAGLGYLDDLAHRNGWTPEIKAEKERAYKASVHQGMIESVLGAGDALRAAKLLEQYGPDLDQAAVNDSKLRQRIDGAGVKQQAEGTATIAWGLSNHNLEDAERRIEEAGITDPRAKDLAIALVRKQNDEFNEAQGKLDNETLSRISQTISKGRGKVTIDQLATDPDYLELRTEKGRAAALRMANAERVHKTGGGGNAVGKAALQEYLALVATDPDTALETNVETEYADVPKIWRDKIRERQGKLGTAEGKKDAVDLSEFNSWVGGKLGKVDKKFRAAVRGELLDAYESYKANNGGKQMPRAEAEKLIAGAFLDGEIDEWGRNPKRTRIEAKVRQQEASWIPTKDESAPGGGVVWMRETDGNMRQVQSADVDAEIKAGSKLVQDDSGTQGRAAQMAADARTPDGKPLSAAQQAELIRKLNARGVK